MSTSTPTPTPTTTTKTTTSSDGADRGGGSSPLTLQHHLSNLLPSSSRSKLRSAVLPTLISSISTIASTLRSAHHVSTVGTANAFGDNQLNVDVLAEQAVREAIARCPGGVIVAASSEEDPVERPTFPPTTTTSTAGAGGEGGSENGAAGAATGGENEERYTLAFDPLDGSSIIGPNWTIGTIMGIWDGGSALNQDPARGQVATILGVCGPRTSVIVALRVPGMRGEKEKGRGTCFEVALNPDDGSMDMDSVGQAQVIAESITLPPSPLSSSASEGAKATRYFAPANLRAAAHSQEYMGLINHYISAQYTLRYSGGLVPDVAHMLAKGHGVYISPTTSKEKAKLRRLYELCPVALVVECAGGRAVEADLNGDGEGGMGKDVLARPVSDVEEKGGVICGTREEVEFAVEALLRASSGG